MSALIRAYRELWVYKFDYKRCFENAQRLLSIDYSGKLVYVEGFVWAHGDRLPPVHHGWLTLHGKVIAVTMVTRAMAHKLPPEPLQVYGNCDGRSYLGVPFLRRYLRDQGLGPFCTGSLLDDEDNGYPLLARGGEGAVRGPTRPDSFAERRPAAQVQCTMPR